MGHVACPACDLQRTAVISGTADLSFERAADVWLSQHQLYISARTLRDYRQYLKPLSSFLGSAKLSDIHIGTVRSYQAWRMQKASNHLVNSEIRSVLKPVMREAGLWEPIAERYKALPVDRTGAGKSYSAEDRDRLLAVAFSRFYWRLAGHCLNVMLNTGMGFGELRQLRRQDIKLDGPNPEVSIVKGAKNRHRIRTVPLNADALTSMRWIVNRWQRLGGNAPDQYVLPNRKQFYSPMGSIKTAFYGIRKEAGLPSAPWKGMRVYDCRVTAITESLSSGAVSLHTAKLLYGHVSEEMQKRYFKPQMDVLREAVTALQKKPVQNQRLRPPVNFWTSSTTV